MRHPVRPGLADGEEDFTAAMNDAERSSDERSEPSMSEEELSQLGEDPDELRRMRAMIAPHATNATPEETRQALEEVQNALLELRGKYRAMEMRNSLLEARTTKGRRSQKVSTLTNQELSVALKEETIRTYGRKYSATHCLWVNSAIFPLHDDPQVDLYSSERWVSALAIEDGVKSELFQFIPKEDHPLMAHRIFGDKFCHGIQCVRSEMVSDVKSTGGAVFGLPGEFFLRNFNRFEEPRCRQLLLSPHQKYTKFAPCLFPNMSSSEHFSFLKTSLLVQVLRVAFFGKSSLAGGNAPGPKPKAKLWNLRSTTAGMVAGAAVVAIFVLSGDNALNTKGDKTQIPYLEWHNYFRSRLLNRDAWARSVMTYFNNALFPETSTSANTEPTETAVEEVDDWELAYQNAFEGGLVAPSSETPSVVQNVSSNSTDHPSTLGPAIPNPISRPPSPSRRAASHPAIPTANKHVAGAAEHRSISAAMQDLALEREHAPPPPPPPPFDPGAVPEIESEEAPIGAKGKARPKPTKRKAKVMTTPDGGVIEQPVDRDNSGMATSNTRKTQRGGNTRGCSGVIWLHSTTLV
ncbi:hypothetical protein EDD15DRAFT_2377080 [Pisolithus albus]|nr:hypothetical protein EDD15DRAFT_2377080 [Pisolithus albus]